MKKLIAIFTVLILISCKKEIVNTEPKKYIVEKIEYIRFDIRGEVKINIDSKDYFFDSHLCFVILYSSEKKINFLFEELIDKIIKGEG